MMKSYLPKMTPSNEQRIAQMIANENLIISDKLMKLEVENKEMFSRYHKLRRAFNELLDEHQELRERHYQSNNQYDWVDRAGLLDDVE